MVDPLDESADNAERLVSAETPEGAAMILHHLLEHEERWRERVGDKAYHEAVAHWAALAKDAGGRMIPMDEVRRRLGIERD